MSIIPKAWFEIYCEIRFSWKTSHFTWNTCMHMKSIGWVYTLKHVPWRNASITHWSRWWLSSCVSITKFVSSIIDLLIDPKGGNKKKNTILSCFWNLLYHGMKNSFLHINLNCMVFLRNTFLFSYVISDYLHVVEIDRTHVNHNNKHNLWCMLCNMGFKFGWNFKPNKKKTQ